MPISSDIGGTPLDSSISGRQAIGSPIGLSISFMSFDTIKIIPDSPMFVRASFKHCQDEDFEVLFSEDISGEKIIKADRDGYYSIETDRGVYTFYWYWNSVADTVSLYKTLICPCDSDVSDIDKLKLLTSINYTYAKTGCLDGVQKVLKCDYNKYCNEQVKDTDVLIAVSMLGLYSLLKGFFGKEYADNLFGADYAFCCITRIIPIDILDTFSQATINIDISANSAPSNVDDKTIQVESGATYVFSSADFTVNYQDPEGDSPYQVRIDSLPQNGVLVYNGYPVSVGDIIPLSDVDNGLLVYIANTTNVNLSDSFGFSVSDIGSRTFIN